METEKLYYQDCNIKSFTAKVTGCEETKGGYAVTLEATAFYPEGGGQPCDLGVLGDAEVLDVREKEDKILHLCDKPLKVGSTVTGSIDWERRLDLMQQHTGEHILSGLIHQKYGAHNVGFHMGADTVTIDFDVMIPPEDLEELENAANQAIYADLIVACEYPPEEALPGIPYRSKKALEYPVRIVTVPGCDCCACCGVHVKTTGQVGLIKILSSVKFHQGSRLEILCGGRALHFFQKLWEQNRLVMAAFSAKALETGVAAQRMNDALAQEKFRATGLQKKLFEITAESYAGKGDVVHFAEELTPGQVRELADSIGAVCGGVSAVFSGDSFCLVRKDGDVKALGQALTKAFNGRGGGKAGVFQGSLKATREEIRDFFIEN